MIVVKMVSRGPIGVTIKGVVYQYECPDCSFLARRLYFKELPECPKCKDRVSEG